MSTETPPVHPGRDREVQTVLPLPRQGEGYATVTELRTVQHVPLCVSHDAAEAYEKLRRDLEAQTGRPGRPWHMLTPVERDKWLAVLKMIDPLAH